MTEILHISEYEAILNDLLAICQTGRFVCLYPHVNADGDALGSSLALALVLQKLGAKVAVLLDEDIPEKMFVLPEEARVLAVSDPQEVARLAKLQDFALVLDCPAGKRLGTRQNLYETAKHRSIIDHHIPGHDRSADRIWLATQAAATCEMIGYLILDCEKKLQRKLLDHVIAVTLMIGLLTDTGRFTYSNTKSATLLLAAELLHYDVPTSLLSSALFEERSLAKSRLQGFVGLNTRFACEGKLAFCLVPKVFAQEVAAVETDFEGIVSEMRHISGIEIAVLLREMEENSYKGSVRTSENFDAQKIAAAFGGGGHIRASGLTLHTTWTEEELLTRFVEVASEQLEQGHA